MNRLLGLMFTTIFALSAIGQEPNPAADRSFDSVLTSLSALGANNGVPDGLGFDWVSKEPVKGQPASMSIFTTQAGLSLPIHEDSENQLFGTATTRWLRIPTKAILPSDRVAFPNNWYDIQTGGLFIQQLSQGESWGLSITGGSITDQPFHTLNEVALNIFAFWRTPGEDNDAWLFYVVSATNGQIGQNIPIPGLAYEFKSTKWSGVIGFPFVDLSYRPEGEWGWELKYAALTDIQTRVNWYPREDVRTFGGFSWTNQAWFRSHRDHKNDQFFYYEKRLETGIVYSPAKFINFEFSGGYAFDRYFFETQNFSLSGRNRVDVANGPFLRFQAELKY